MQIILKDKIYTAPTQTAMIVRKVIAIQENLKNYERVEDMKVKDLDDLVGLVVEIYANQFTVDDFYNGVNATDLNDVLFSSITGVMHKTSEALDQFPKND